MREILIERFPRPDYIDELGTMYWFDDYGEFHSIDDRPAIICASGVKYWYKNGKIHRDGNKPAATFVSGKKEYWKNGMFVGDSNIKQNEE